MAELDCPICEKCGLPMTPQDSRLRPELFLHDRCLPEDLRGDPPPKQPAIREAVVLTEGDWKFVADVRDRSKLDSEFVAGSEIRQLCAFIDSLTAQLAARDVEIERLKARLLTAAGDDLCRLTQEEIKAMSLGQVKIPPKEEFLASCERFHAQVAGEVGVNENCLTLAQLIAENAALKARVEAMREACQAMIEWSDREEDHAVPFADRMALCERAFALARAALAQETP